MEKHGSLVDANILEVGDFVDEILDNLIEGENPSESCHCAIVASADPHKVQKGPLRELRVLTHDLLPGDVILGKQGKSEDCDCHCDYWWTVSRVDRPGIHPLAMGTRVYHQSQQWHRAHMGGTGTIVGIYGPRGDESFDYRVMTGVDFSRRIGPNNPEDRLTDWDSEKIRKANT